MNTRADSVWGRIETIRDGAHDQAWEAAWTYLVARYRPGLEAHARFCLLRLAGGGVAAREAGELTDSFIARLPQGTAIDQADASKGSFRAWMNRRMYRFARDWIEKQRAAKRRPASGDVASLDALHGFEPGVGSSPDADVGLAWTRCLLDAALERVRARSPRNARLLHHLLSETPPTDPDLALLLEVESQRIPLLRHKARVMLAEEVWEELKQSVSGAQALDDERRVLRPFLGDLIDPKKAGSFFRMPSDKKTDE